MSNTPVLDLPEIAEGVASQTVLHNEALRRIEARLVRALSRTTMAPPGSPAEGDSYIIPTGSPNTWGGTADQVASYIGGAWSYYTPLEGVRLWINDDDEEVVYDGAAWTASGGGGGSGDVVGPASSTDGHFAQFDGATGKLLKDTIALDTDGTLAANSDTRVASQKAVKTYVTAHAGTGDVVGPASSTADHFATYDGTTGKLLKDTIALDTDTTLAADSDTRVASQKAVKAYVTASAGGGGTVRLDQIATGTADSPLATSGTVTMSSGVGAANTTGKTLSITAGAGGATNAAGGVVTITAGAGTGSGTGGIASLTGGASGLTDYSLNAGGIARIEGGPATSAMSTAGAAQVLGGSGYNGGIVTITGGTSTNSGSNGPAVNITGGVPTTSGTGGPVNIVGGVSAGGGSTGGAVSITGGAGYSGGSVSITSGSATSYAAGGITIQCGTSATNAAGGAVSITGAAGNGVAGGGALNLTGGASGASYGAGGPVNITAGTGVSVEGGSVVVRPGAGGSRSGNICLDSGIGGAISTSATGGFVTIPTCAGTPTGTPAGVPSGSVAMVFDTTGVKLWIYTGGAWKGVVVA